MKNIDNMGGILFASFILTHEIKNFVASQNKCIVNLIEDTQWKLIKAKKNGISITITPSNESGGTLYTIKGTIQCRPDAVNLDILKATDTIILRYQTPDGVDKVAGTDQYPLQVTVKPLTPNKANGFAGYEINFSGKQLIEPPVLQS